MQLLHSGMIQRLIEYFIPHPLNKLDSDFRQSKILIGVILISILSNLGGAYNAFSMKMNWVAYLVIFNAIFSILLLFIYKMGISRRIVGNIFVLQFELSFIGQAWFQGGLISPATAAFFLVPATAMLLIGKRDAVVWVLLSCLAILAIYFYQLEYGGPAVELPLIAQLQLFAFSYIAINVAVFFILLIYENGKNKAIEELDKQHKELKLTQNQLIQSEKMASLGELTAGIAHEIQNPLNFVNNFSEVSIELINEMNENINNGDLEEVKSISQSIQTNLEKIVFHGSRADSIVKGMLLHSRTSSGQRQPTDLNLLIDEYLRLAFHGMRSRDNKFNCVFLTEYDDLISQINVIPQEIGRVFLNMFNNSFYSIQEKLKQSLGMQPAHDFTPEIKITTKNDGEFVVIQIVDNGMGIPNDIRQKVFQPFFTTKPPGEGTGLGLSLSYEIIKNTHNGDLSVDSKEGEFTSFTIRLPIN